MVKLTDCNLNYEKNGKGPVIVFVHGLSDDLNFWKPLTSYYEKNYTTIAIDNRGHGKTTYKNGTISMPQLQEDIYQLLQYLKIKKVIIIGFSMGGNISLSFTIHHPEMVEKLILMSSFSKTSPELREQFGDIYCDLNKGLGEFYDAMIPLVLPDDVICKYEDALEHGREKCLTKNQEGIKESIIAGLEFDVTDKLKNITQPTLIIGGKDDCLTPNELMIKINNEIPDSKLVFLENTKHNILIPSNINKIRELVDEFIEN